MHRHGDAKYEAVGWTHSLVTRTCYARLKADKAVIERCHDVAGCAVAPGGWALAVAALIAGVWRRRR